MRKIEKPKIDYRQELIDLNNFKAVETRNRFTNSIDMLISLGNTLDRNFSAGTFVIPTDYTGLLMEKDEMIKLYEYHFQKSDYYKQIKIKEKCPICELRPVEELDHYCEKSVYYPFSVYPNNLIPVCHSCNHTKLAFNAASKGFRIFNAYYDDFRLIENLTIEADFSQGKYMPTTIINHCYPIGIYNLLVSNFNEFDLFVKYNEEAVLDFDELLNDLLSYPEINTNFNIDYFQFIINRKYINAINRLKNSYKTAFYRGILDNIDEAYEYVKNWLSSYIL